MRTRMMTIAAVALGAASAASAGPADPYANAPAYVKPVAPGVTTGPILTVGEMVPLTGGAPGAKFRVVGIPDGLGARSTGGHHGNDREVAVLMNHEFGPTSGGPAGP